MTKVEFNAKHNTKNISSHEAMRSLSDTMFMPREVWNAAKAIQWTIKTGRISALKEHKFEQMNGEQVAEIVFSVAERAETATGAAASKVFIEIMKAT